MNPESVVYALTLGLFAGLAAAALERVATLLSRRPDNASGAPAAPRPNPAAINWLPALRRLPWIAAMIATAAAPLFNAQRSARAVVEDEGGVAAMASAILSDPANGSFWLDSVLLLTRIPDLLWASTLSVLQALNSAAVAALQPIEGVIPLIWVLTSLALLGFGTVVALRLHRTRRSWRKHSMDGVPVLVSPDCGPAVIGLWSGRIVVPEWLLELAQPLRAMVIQHEREHLRVRDPGLLTLAAIALVLQPWNPALWWQLRRLRLAIELDCDSRVLRSGVDVERYGLLLLAVGQRTRRTLATVAALAEDRTFIARRITNMTENNQTPALRRTLTWAALAAVAVAVACNVPDTSSVTDETGEPESVSTSLAAPAVGDAYYEYQVEKQVGHLPNSAAPEYPPELRSAGVTGRVIAQFVVDTDGLVVPGSFVATESDHEGFTEAVRAALPQMRFTPAEAPAGTPVKQFVQQPFVFAIQ